MRPLGKAGAVVAAGGYALALLVQCSSRQNDCTDDRFRSAGLRCTADLAEGGNDAGGDAFPDVVVPPGCDLTKAPKDSAACVDDGVGVFVAPSGDDGATGKKAAPVKTIGKGVELAASRGLPRVYVCEGTYDAAVEIKAAASVYGGFSCAWTYTGAKPKLAPPKGIALRVTKASGAVLVEDFEIVGSADQNAPGDSAITAFVSESSNVTFRNVSLAAGNATAGSKGASRSNYTGSNATKGANGSGATAGIATICTCTDATTSTGGSGASGAGGGIQNGSANPAVGGANAGSTSATTCGDGQPGVNGAGGTAGTSSSAAGTVSAAGWTNAATGPNAPNGNPAQGGGGGGAKTDVTSAGGGGGCGGCGGAGGAAGTNGGSSFALLSFNSTVSIEAGALVSGGAGRGGDGGDGQAGQGGGGTGTGPACNGGAGGNGAGGSGGGGGAGGHSVPIAFVGTEPRVSGATITPGAKGSGGSGGGAGAGLGNAGTAGTAGPEGKSQNTLSL